MCIPYSSSTKEERVIVKAFESQMPESNIFEPEIESPLIKPLMDRDLAALKLQKTYKSFRTRRQLADCAILVEHRWLVIHFCFHLSCKWVQIFMHRLQVQAFFVYRWKLLDFAVLKCSSVSFFEIEKPETAVSRWSRARTRAAKVHISFIFIYFTLNSVFIVT